MKNTNAVIKAIGSNGRVVVPASMTKHMNKNSSIKVLRHGYNSIILSQYKPRTKAEREYMDECTLSVIKPFDTGAVQLHVAQYFREQEPTAVVCFNQDEDVIINCLD